MNLWYLFNFTIKKISNINVILKYLLLKTTSKKLNKKKFYLIVLTDLQFKTLAMLSIKIIAKLSCITNQVKLEYKSDNKRKANLESKT